MNIKHLLLVPGFIMASHISDAKVLQSRNNTYVYAHPQREAKGVRDVVWFTPSRAKKINGLAIGFAAIPAWKKTQEINGVNIEVDPLGLFVAIYSPMIFIQAITYSFDENNWFAGENYFLPRLVAPKSDSITKVTINGLDINPISCSESKNVGLSINLIAGNHIYEKGLAMSGIINMNNHFKGAQIAPLCNVSAYGKGLSVALVNVCYNCSGLQIGLINKNGKRTTPFLSYRSKKKALRIAKEQHIAEAFFK